MVRKSKNQLKWEKRIKQRNQGQYQEQESMQEKDKNQINKMVSLNIQQQKYDQIVQEKNNQRQLVQKSQNIMLEGLYHENRKIIITQQKQCQQINRISQKNDKLKKTIQCMGKGQIYLREKEKQQIVQFLNSVTQQILYICGVTGTGKTTTILTTLEKLKINYKFINCIINSEEQKYLCSEDRSQRSQVYDVLVIDECDQLKDINLVLTCLKLNMPQIKIVLICNQSCQYKIKSSFPLYIIYFLPYNKDCIAQILKLKLGEQQAIIPNMILKQAEIMATKKGGDFRETEKHITNWAKLELMKGVNQNQNYAKSIHMHHNFGDVFPKIIYQFLKQNNDKQNRLLLIVCDKCQQSKEYKNRRIKFNVCICEKKSNISHIINEIKFQMTSYECHFILKTWQEMGILQIKKAVCKFHQKQSLTLKLRVNNFLLKKMLIESFYYK